MRRWGLICLALALLPSMFLASPALSKTAEESFQNTVKMVQFSGFDAGATISFEIKTITGETVFEGQAQASEAGQAIISRPKDLLLNDPLTLHFEIEDSQNPLKFTLRSDQDGTLQTISGSGAEPFTNIAIDSGRQTLATKSDWAGLFEETDLAIDRHNARQSAPLKLAFMGAGAAQSINDVSNPAMIDIYYLAFEGGGPTPILVNTYTTTYCGDDPEISYCDTALTDQYNQNIVDNLVEPLKEMTEQLVYAGTSAVGQIGRFFDSKEMLENMRDQQVLRAQAVKDYHPSEQMCRVGSFTKSLASSEFKMHEDKQALNKILTDTYQNKRFAASQTDRVSYFKARLEQYRTVYCDPMDNNGGLFLLCEHDQNEDLAGPIGAVDPLRVNKDIDYARTLGFPLTLDVDYATAGSTADEEDVVALARNLYWTDPIRTLPENSVNLDQKDYAETRRLLALNSLAHNSYAQIAAMKGKSFDPAGGVVPGWAHMKTLLREFGMTDQEIEQLQGENPSYYAQMDILTKKLYQNPDFYTELYDKPANVERLSAAMKAISLMQMRDHYESATRHELLTSGMVAEALQPRILLLRGTIEDFRAD